MKAAVVSSPGRVELSEVLEPSAQEGEVLVRMKCCGVCGTDVEKVHGKAITSKILGHEVVGEIEEVGPGVQGLSTGMRVFTHHHVPCYSCDVCKAGNFTYCPEFGRSNLRPCGLAEKYVVPGFNVERGAVLRLPESLGYEAATFIEPLACCVRAIDLVSARTARSAAVYGAGPVGLLHFKLLQHLGVRDVAVGDVSAYRRSFAESVGCAKTFDPLEPESKKRTLHQGGASPDLVILATGSPAAFQDALANVNKAGTVLLFGAPSRGAQLQLDLSQFFLNGTRIVSSYATTEKETKQAMDLIATGAVDVMDLVTHRFALADSDRAFAAAAEQRCMKALIAGT